MPAVDSGGHANRGSVREREQRQLLNKGNGSQTMPAVDSGGHANRGSVRERPETTA